MKDLIRRENFLLGKRSLSPPTSQISCCRLVIKRKQPWVGMAGGGAGATGEKGDICKTSDNKRKKKKKKTNLKALERVRQVVCV